MVKVSVTEYELLRLFAQQEGVAQENVVQIRYIIKQIELLINTFSWINDFYPDQGNWKLKITNCSIKIDGRPGSKCREH